MDNPAAADCDAGSISSGLLKQAPDWLDMLIKRLPARNKVAVFGTCRQLAKQVIESASCVVLQLNTATATPLSTVDNLIEKVLRSSRKVSLSVQWPFPDSIYDRVHTLTLATKATTCPCFQSLTHLRKLTLAICNQQVLNELCAALELGHLKELNSVEFGDLYPYGYLPSFKRVALAVGPRITELRANCHCLVHYLSHFKQLKYVRLCNNSADPDLLRRVIAAVSSLPRMAVLRFPDNHYIEGYDDDLKHDNSCKKLVVGAGFAYKRLESLPLAEAQTIEFHGGLSYCDLDALQVFKRVLAQHGQKVSFTFHEVPHDMFSLHVWDSIVQQVAQGLESVRTCSVGWSMQFDSLKELWRVLPSSMQHVKFSHRRGPGWLCIWDGLPISVSDITLYSCCIDTLELRELVSSAPKHVKTLSLVHVHSGKGSMHASSLTQYAPPHLSVTSS